MDPRQRAGVFWGNELNPKAIFWINNLMRKNYEDDSTEVWSRFKSEAERYSLVSVVSFANTDLEQNARST